MKKIGIILFALAGLGYGAYSFLGKGEGAAEIEYRYSKIEQGELVRSISATGQLVALTAVDVKSKAGGRVVELKVEEGTKVLKGDLIALIDPIDTQAAYDQAKADYDSSTSRAQQARLNAQLQGLNSRTAVREAEVNLELARVRLRRAQTQNITQPKLTASSINSAQAALRNAEAELRQLELVTIPQLRKDAATGLDRARVELKNAEAEVSRQRQLFERGYASRAEVERAEGAIASAQATFANATQRQLTLEKQIDSDLQAQRARVEQSRESLKSANANSSQVDLAKISVEEAAKSVRQAEVNLRQAKDAMMQDQIRAQESRQAASSTVRSRVQLKNAQVQLDSTTVTAPRDGVVTLKYLEEGTIIPPGTSTFSQGTSLVQISDTTRMFVECAVDEADISQVKLGQDVRLIIEAFPGENLEGKVTRINPAARTENNITAVKVRVEVASTEKVQLLPGMNATCEFLTLRKPQAILAPAQALERDKGETFVLIKKGGKPTKQVVKVGATGNDSIEILEGLKEGDEVVVAKVDLKALRETQKKMAEAQQGGGLAGGAGQNRGMGGGGRGGGGGGGGARSGGGGR